MRRPNSDPSNPAPISGVIPSGVPSLSGRYELREIIGEGGSGRVYRAYDATLGREVALKTLKTPAPEDAYRLKKEFRNLVDVAHPNLVRLYDLFVAPDYCFFTMELVRGTDFLTWVRSKDRPAGAPLDPEGVERLRVGLPQLVDAVHALHELGKLHRDIKPSNVLVGDGGRVVLVDVGLASRIESYQSELSRFGSIAGTLEYMAPEQMRAQTLTRAADWYSVGVLLYEALSGGLPYGQRGPRLLNQTQPGVVPKDLPDGSDPRLGDLAMGLLAGVPSARPDYAGIRERLGLSSSAPVLSPSRGPFLGRAAEIGFLAELRSSARAGIPTFGYVSGPPGLGKTALVERFLSDLPRTPNTLILRGRCHYREFISFNALDGIVDDLSRYLDRLPESELASLIAEDLSPLLQVFPVMGRVGTLRQVYGPATLAHDTRLRHLSFVILRDLLRRIAEQVELVIFIDDLQWVDRESLVFLRSLQKPPALGGMLVLYAFRSSRTARETLEPLLGASPRGGVVRSLTLGPMPDQDVRRLVAELAEGATDDEVSALSRVSGGVPLFARALSNSRSLHRAEFPVGIGSFEEFVASTLTTISPSTLDVLKTVCLLRHAVDQRVLGAGGPTDTLEQDLATLQRAMLIRQTLVRGRVCWEPTDDRIREVVLGRVTDAGRAELYERLGTALARVVDPDPHHFLEQLLGSGRRELAMEHGWIAARTATERAAFETAVSLYERLLELGVPPEDEWRIRTELGRALSNAGHIKKGARELVAAADLLDRIGPGNPESMRLRAAAGERLLLSGYWDEGFELTHAALGAVDAPYARTAAGALARAALYAPRAMWAERKWNARAEQRSDPPSPREAATLDVIWSAGLAISWLDPMRAMELQVRHAALAYALGDAGHIARTKSARAIIRAMLGGETRWKEADSLQEQAQRLAERSEDAEVQTFVSVYAGVLEFFRGNWREALRLSERGIELCYRKAVGFVPVLGFAEWTCLTCLSYLGEIQEVRSRIPQYLLAVEARREQLNTSLFRVGWISVHWLCADEPDEAFEQARLAMAPYENAKFNSVHYLHATAKCNAELYCERPDRAFQGMLDTWEGLSRSLQLKMVNVHAEMHDAKGRAAVACAAGTRDSRRRSELLGEARRCAKALSGNPLPYAAALSSALNACIAGLESDTGAMIANLERALVGFDRFGMAMHAAACRVTLSLRDPLRRKENLEIADAWFRSQGVRRPERITEVLLPGSKA